MHGLLFPFAGLSTIRDPRPRRQDGDGKAGFMKRIVTLLIVLLLLLFLGVLALMHVRGRNGGAGENMTAGQDQTR